MTGRYNQRTKCLDTYLGRSMMATDEVTIAEALSGAGYATGIFGKWHLGDNYPMRPSDQGFEYSLVHRGGGLGQPADPVANKGRYTDPILFRNNEEVQRFSCICFSSNGQFTILEIIFQMLIELNTLLPCQCSILLIFQ